MRHAVIMAGGAGTRLWPLSRKKRPKHFLNLIEGKSLMRSSFERLASFLPPEQINVITSADHLDLVAAEIPELPRANLIGEPAVRDTANAVGLSAFILQQRDPDGVMGIFTADHIIKPLDRFQSAVESAYAAAAEHSDALIRLGIQPTEPHTGYGYMRRGQRLSDKLYQVQEFKEKPDARTAQAYIDSGDYYWNSGMFVWRTQTLLNQFKKHLPRNYELLSKLEEVASSANSNSCAGWKAKIAEIYPELKKISIDYGVMEKADKVMVCEMNCDWLDLGSWAALEHVLPTDASGQVDAHGKILTIKSRGNIFVGEGDHLIAGIGLENMVVVHSADATLICPKDQVQHIKELVDLLDEQYR